MYLLLQLTNHIFVGWVDARKPNNTNYDQSFFLVMAENDKTCHNIENNIHGNHLMKSMNISLPDTMRAYVEQLVAQGGYSSVSEYFRELVRQDQKQRAKEQLQTMLLEGLNSGEATEMTAQEWEDIRQAVRDKINNRQGAI